MEAPRDRGRFATRYRGTRCLNCGHSLDRSDRYCPSCSQANSTKKLTLRDFFREFLSEVVNYDSKLLKTLSALIGRPGTITRDYIAGKRLTYTNPFRFLLSLAIVYFLLLAGTTRFSRLDRAVRDMDGSIPNTPFVFDGPTGNLQVDSIRLVEQRSRALDGLDSLRRYNPELVEGLQVLDTIQINTAGRNRSMAERDSLKFADPPAHFRALRQKSGLNSFAQRVDFFYKGIKRDTLYTFDDAVARYGIQDRFTNKMAFSWAHGIDRMIKEPGRYLKSTLSKLPLVIFLFLPVFALFIWLAYIRKNHTYTDHLIFSFHNQALLFILLILSLLLDLVLKVGSTWIFLIVFGGYLYKAMRNFYGQGRLKTILKFCFLNTVFFFLALWVLMIAFTGSIFIYN